MAIPARTSSLGGDGNRRYTIYMIDYYIFIMSRRDDIPADL